MDNENIFGPKKIRLLDVGINTAGAFISGVIGSVLLLFIVFIVSGMVDIPLSFKEVRIGVSGNNPIFPFFLSIITFIVSIIVAILTYYFLTLTEPGKYKRTIIHLSQISFFSILTYIFIAPVYIYVGMIDYNNIMTIFIIHSLIISFGITILLEIMNNYRYILLGFYASFIGLFITGIISFFIFSVFSTGYAKFLSLLLILPLINGLIIFFKGLFEIVYYKYFIIYGKDQLGDIFKQIEQEEVDEYNDAVNESNTY